MLRIYTGTHLPLQVVSTSSVLGEEHDVIVGTDISTIFKLIVHVLMCPKLSTPDIVTVVVPIRACARGCGDCVRLV